MLGRREAAKAAAALDMPSPPIASADKRDQQQHLAQPVDEAARAAAGLVAVGRAPAAVGEALLEGLADRLRVGAGRQQRRDSWCVLMLPGWISPRRRQPGLVDQRRRARRRSPTSRGILSMIPDTRSVAAAEPQRDRRARRQAARRRRGRWRSRRAPGRLPGGQLERARPAARRASTPVSSASIDSPLGRDEHRRACRRLFDDRPERVDRGALVGASPRAARRVSSRSPPSSARPLAAIARSIDEARLVTDDRPAIAMARHSHSRPSPPSPPLRSRRARRSAGRSRGQHAVGHVHRPRRRAPRPPGHG